MTHLHSPPDGFVLSLDFRGETFLGPQGLLDDAALWPHRVIVMTLARVGGGEGPDRGVRPGQGGTP